MKVVEEFSRFAHHYEHYNVVQTEVAKRLVKMIEADFLGTIIDLGCGSGAVYKELQKSSITFDHFFALDLSSEMLSLHPDASGVTKVVFDFNDTNAFKELSISKADLVVSSSALQWSRDLTVTLNEIKQLSPYFYGAIFTSNTFTQLHVLAGISSPIYGPEDIKQSIVEHFEASFETVAYRLPFENVRKMFQYIKKSGVSGAQRSLDIASMRRLMREYPYDYLEFEVLFVKGISKV